MPAKWSLSPRPADRGTIVTVLQEFRQGKLATAAETIFSRNPKQAVIENLRHFKAFAETGEIPRTEGQPHGPRGASAKLKASAYGENIEVPPTRAAQGELSVASGNDPGLPCDVPEHRKVPAAGCIA